MYDENEKYARTMADQMMAVTTQDKVFFFSTNKQTFFLFLQENI